MLIALPVWGSFIVLLRGEKSGSISDGEIHQALSLERI